MKELNTKPGVFLTTYTQGEIDAEIEEGILDKESDGCKIFLDKLRSFNPVSALYISEREAIELTGLEMKKSKKNPQNLYTNYKGVPFNLPIDGVTLYFTDPILSLRSAFEAAAPEFDFSKDFFHINVIK
ncbi:MAG: hypothetical protein AABY15_01775 [Nanoarchaeota archaeon]